VQATERIGPPRGGQTSRAGGRRGSRAVRRALARIVLPYALVGSAWILLSDRALRLLVEDAAAYARWSTVKGWGFVAATALLLLLLVSRELRARERVLARGDADRDRLRREEALLRAVAEGVPDAIYVKDAAGRYRLINAAGCRMLRRSREEVLGRDDAALRSPEESRRTAALEREVLASRRISTIDETVVIDGEERILRATRGPVRDARGEVVGVFGLLRDRTDQHRAEEQLRRSETRLRFALEQSHTGGWELDLVDHSAHRTLEHDRIFGYSELLPGWSYEQFLDHVLPEDRAEVDRRFQAAVAAGTDWSFECRIQRADGAVRWIWAAGGHQLEGPGPPRRMAGIVQDVTERKQRETQLRELVAVIQRLAEARDRAEVLAAVRAAARRLAGADGATFVLREGGDSFYADEDAIAPLWKGRRFPLERCVSGWAILHRQPVVIEDVYADPRVLVEAYRPTFVRSLAMVPIRAGEPLGAIGVYWARHHRAEPETLRLLETLADATAIALENLRSYAELEAQVEERTLELHAAKERAERADRLKSAFLATMSHELRTPLNSVIGFSGILLQGLAGPLTGEQRKQLGMVQGSARHLLALINDVLDLSKIEAGELRVAREPVDLPALIERAVASVRPAAAAKKLALRAAIAPELGEVATDGRRVEQILLNLLSNAIKFTPRGEVALEARVADGRILVEVADTGIGIAARDFESLFRPFSQLDQGLARSHEGTGLGLAICQRLARLLAGEITVESAPGAGSRFVLALPIDGGEAP